VGSYNQTYSLGITLEVGDRVELKLYENQTTGVRKFYVNGELQGDDLNATDASLILSAITLATRSDSVSSSTNVIIHNTVVEDHTNDVVYNYTMSDDDTDELIDINNNAHLTLTSPETSGWVQVVPKEVVTIGVGKDYDGITTFFSGKRSSDNKVRGLIYQRRFLARLRAVGSRRFALGY